MAGYATGNDQCLVGRRPWPVIIAVNECFSGRPLYGVVNTVCHCCFFVLAPPFIGDEVKVT